jgi:holliday junction DNA helicase RuvA
MIEYVHGELAELIPTLAVVEAGGVGYALNISLTTYDALKNSREVRLYVHENIREDAYILYGFASRDERTVFEALLSVSGVGGNTARTILSAFSPDEFRAVVASEDLQALKSVKGIGLKTAQRIIVDLNGKLGAAQAVAIPGTISGRRNAEEAVGALVTLGYPAPAAQKAVNAILKQTADAAVEDLIKQALKML